MIPGKCKQKYVKQPLIIHRKTRRNNPHLIHADIMRFACDRRQTLKIIPHADFFDTGIFSEKPVIVSSAPSETVSLRVKCETRHDRDLDG